MGQLPAQHTKAVPLAPEGIVMGNQLYSPNFCLQMTRNLGLTGRQTERASEQERFFDLAHGMFVRFRNQEHLTYL